MTNISIACPKYYAVQIGYHEGIWSLITVNKKSLEASNPSSTLPHN